MNKILAVVGVAVLAVVVWMIFQPDTIDYVAEVNNEVAELEAELVDIEAAMEAGTLTPEQAAEAQVKIIARIDAVNTKASASQKSKLTDAQRAELAGGLLRLADTLKSYQATLVAVDEAVLELPEADRPVLRRGGGENRAGVAVIADEAIEIVEEQVEEIIEEITDENLANEVASSTVEIFEPEENTGTSTDETMSDDSNVTNEDGPEGDENGSDDETVEGESTESEEGNETMLDVSTEAEADFSAGESEEESLETN